MKLEIDRNTWARGHWEGGYLWDPDTGKSCCLGFFGRACGYTNKEMEPHETLSYLRDDRGSPQSAGPELQSVADQEGLLISYNDSRELSEEEREQMIAEEFAKHGVEVTFTGPQKK